jgi:hypothetical protein
VRMGIFIGYLKVIGYSPLTLGLISRGRNYINNTFTSGQCFLDKCFWNIDGCLGNTEFQLSGKKAVQVFYKGFIFFFGELTVILFTQSRNHSDQFVIKLGKF